jgi:heme exporter protein C
VSYRNGLFGRILAALSLLGILAALYMVLLWVPTERQMGVVQRIFYFHMPLAVVAFLSFFVVFVASIAWLVKNKREWDMLAVAAAELGLLFCTLVLVTGSIWAKAIWGVWWTWDPRLTTTLVLWLIYVGYFMLRSALADPLKRARLAAIVGIIGFVDVPIVFMSIRWWRTIHPTVVTGEGMLMEGPMAVTLVVALVAILLLYAYLLLLRFRLEADSERLADLREDVADRCEVDSSPWSSAAR